MRRRFNCTQGNIRIVRLRECYTDCSLIMIKLWSLIDAIRMNFVLCGLQLSPFIFHLPAWSLIFLLRMFNIRRVIPTICRFETSLSRLSSFSTVLPSRTTVPFQFVSRPISTSTTVWKKKEVIDKEEENDEDDDGLPKDYNKKTIKVLKRFKLIFYIWVFFQIGSRRLDTFVAKSAGVPSSWVFFLYFAL